MVSLFNEPNFQGIIPFKQESEGNLKFLFQILFNENYQFDLSNFDFDLNFHLFLTSLIRFFFIPIKILVKFDFTLNLILTEIC